MKTEPTSHCVTQTEKMNIQYRELKKSDDEDMIRTIWSEELLKNQTDLIITQDYIKRHLDGDMSDIYANYVGTGGTFCVAETDDLKIIGFIGIFRYKGRWEMVRLNVLEKFRRRKIGSELSGHVIQWFKNEHPGEMLCASTDIGNKPSYDLLHKVGFQDKCMITKDITDMTLVY
jgi:GNAT superfamily N-acetyltransferase